MGGLGGGYVSRFRRVSLDSAALPAFDVAGSGFLLIFRYLFLTVSHVRIMLVLARANVSLYRLFQLPFAIIVDLRSPLKSNRSLSLRIIAQPRMGGKRCNHKEA